MSEVRFEVMHAYLAQHCFFLPLPVKMLPPPVKKQKTPACRREIQAHKLWTTVYFQKKFDGCDINSDLLFPLVAAVEEKKKKSKILQIAAVFSLTSFSITFPQLSVC